MYGYRMKTVENFKRPIPYAKSQICLNHTEAMFI